MTLVLAAVFAAPAAAAVRPVAAEDLFHMNLLQQAVISPDGLHVAAVRQRMNGPKDTYDSTVLLVDVAHATTIDATKGTTDGDLAWSPDSKYLYFVRTPAKKKPQIFRYDVATAKIVQISNVKNGASGPVPSHDGKHIAFTVVDTDPAPNARIDFVKAGFTPTKDEKKSDIRAIDELFYENNGQGFVYDKHPHIWVIDAGGTGARQITKGRWGENNYAWSADNRTLVFNSLQYDTVDSGPNDIYTVSADGGTIAKMTSDKPSNNVLFVSRKSNRLIYGAGDVTDPAEYQAMRWANFDGSGVREFVPKNSFSFGDALLADMKEGGGPCGDLLPDEKRAVINADGPGYANLRYLDLQTGQLSDLTPARGEAFSCSLSSDGKRVAYIYSDFTHPADVYVVDIPAGSPRQLTRVNDAYLRSAQLSEPQPFTVKDSAGFTVHAWFMPALTGSAPHPTLLDIHGGPETQFGDTFFQEFQYWAGLGYNIVFSDPRGSVGFGYQFEAALTKSYGDAMFEDVQAVMDEAVKRTEVDASRLGVTGGSYGGYATMWVVSHTDRYKTAIAERAVDNLVTENNGADFASKNGLGGFYQWGNPWDMTSLWHTMSPINYVKNVHTPTMVLHADLDTRATSDQTITWFTLMKILGQKITFVEVPDENHDLSRTGAPIHRVERLHIMADWMNSYLHP
ncbi:MAG: S9 family peptidase [Candidatus Eremiobacteraeota bacterium]|nr:S9 family peptidase [Candidatus Eremiobacteraeota bacterium]